MKRDLDAVVAQSRAGGARLTVTAAACAFAVVAIVALHRETAASIVSIWSRSETFTHGFFVVPICLWLVWRSRARLAATPARVWWPGLALIVVASAMWLVAAAADIVVGRQLALAFMIQAAIVTIAGPAVARVIAFPLAFLLFAVPAGDFLVPTLIDWTANFTVAALRATGVPVYREGNVFVIPTGVWSVVEACSGVRYIIASLMVGTIYAAIAYRSPVRRGLFLLLSIVVPIVANWLRAFMIVMIGHLSENRLAHGLDHFVYGWVLFGIVMLTLFWIGSFWQEPAAPAAVPAVAPTPPGIATVRTRSSGPRSVVIAAVATIVVTGLGIPADALTGRGAVHALPELPEITGAEGWQAAGTQLSEWRPDYGGYAVEYRQAYRNGGQYVGLHITFYRDQSKGAELITSANALASFDNRDWRQVGAGSETIVWDGRPRVVDHAVLRGPGATLDAFRVYWVAGHLTSNQLVAKGWLAWSRLTGGGDDSALIVVYAPRRESSGDATRRALRSFVESMSPLIDRALAAGAASRR